MNAHNRLDLIGKRFNRLLVLRDNGTQISTGGTLYSMWLCRCDCGNLTVAPGKAIKRGTVKSCGCLSRESAATRSATHQMTGSRTYRIWCAMKTRCKNKNVPNFQNYGGKGIEVCKEWDSFSTFIRDMGEAPDGYSIDRINNELGYFKENCRWADRKTQNRNKTSNRVISFNGVSKLLIEWAEELKIDQASLRERLEKWPLARALTQPKKGFTHGNA